MALIIKKKLRSGETAECCVCGTTIKHVAETPAGIMGFDCYEAVKRARAAIRFSRDLGQFAPRVVDHARSWSAQ